jgi:DNA-binding LacI/PurR family transcriptional regulator
MSSPQSRTIGLVLRRSPRQVGVDPFFAELIGGMEETLAPLGYSLLLQVVPSMQRELDSYQRWSTAHEVAGVVLVDFVTDDRRVAVLGELGIPTLVLGEAAVPAGVAAIRADNHGAMTDAVAYLAGLGHRSIGRVSGPVELLHTAARSVAFTAVVRQAGLTGTTEAGDYSGESGEVATRALLARAEPPTAIIYDNDLMAIAALALAGRSGVAVPAELSLLAWDDSTLCRLASPPLSVVHHDVHELGEQAAAALVELIDGGEARTISSEPARIIRRATTAPPAGLVPVVPVAPADRSAVG